VVVAVKEAEGRIMVAPVADDVVVKAVRGVIVRIRTMMMVVIPRTRHANPVPDCWKCTPTATVFCAVPRTTIHVNVPTPLFRAP
jgi:hypothetical protein